MPSPASRATRCCSIGSRPARASSARDGARARTRWTRWSSASRGRRATSPLLLLGGRRGRRRCRGDGFRVLGEGEEVARVLLEVLTAVVGHAVEELHPFDRVARNGDVLLVG